MRIFGFHLIAVFLWVFCPAGSMGQSQIKQTGIPFIQHHSKKDYRGGTQSWAFTQADNHVLYVANNQGILTYDGAEWDLIPLPNGSVVRSLFKDPDGTIYAGGFNEIGIIQTSQSGQQGFFSLYEGLDGRESGEFWRMARQGDYTYFQSYTTLLIWNRVSNEWKSLEPSERFGFLHQLGEQLIINNEGKGLQRLNGFSMLPMAGGEFFAEMDVWAIHQIEGALLVCTQNDGVFLFKESRASVWQSEVNEFLLQNKLFSTTGNEHYFFWGSILNGLIISDHRGKIIRHLNKETGLTNNTILSLFLDMEGALWMGLDNGISQVFINSPLSELVTTEDIGSGYAAAFYQDKVFLGTNQGLFWVENFLLGRPSGELLKLHQIPELAGQVWSLNVAGDELIVGHNLGTFSIRGNRIRQIGRTMGGWNFLAVPETDNLYLQGTYYGLEVYQRGREGMGVRNSIRGFGESSRVIFFESQRVLWMGHGYEGVFRIELDADLTTAIDVTCFDEQSGLGTKSFNELLMVGPEVVVSNPSGIFVYDPNLCDFVRSERWNQIFGQSGRITRLYREDPETLWYFQVEESGKLRTINDTLFLKDDRILAPLAESFIPSFENITFLSERDYLLGTDEGFVHLDPGYAKTYTGDFPVLFKSMIGLRNDSVRFFSYLDQAGNPVTIPPVPYRNNDIRVHFVAPCLTLPARTEYRYKLEGLHPDWTSWSGISYAELINLREGEYNLRVQARNVFGMAAKEASLIFEVKTPWYRTLWAYLSFIIILFLSIFISYRLVDLKLKREKRRTKILEERRMLHKNLKLKRDSELAEREIVKLRNEKLRAEVRHKSKELANQTMGIIQKNKFLTDIKEEMVRLKSHAQSEEVKTSMKKMIRKIDRNIEDEDTQLIFETNFDQVHENFLLRLREAYPELTARDLRLCAYLRLNLSSKEIAPLLNISIRGVEISRYRLRKKMNLPHSEHLADFILRF
jgi:DNA-binding CsgD family transcriptional regulator